MTAWSEEALDYFAARAIDPDLAAERGVREFDGEIHFLYPDAIAHDFTRARSLKGDGPKVRQPKGTSLCPWQPIPRSTFPSALVCEGESDALAALSALPGARHWRDLPVVAVPGTGFPAWRMAEFLRDEQCGHPYLALDADEAGRKYTRALVDELAAVGIQPIVVDLPDGTDLAENLAALERAERGDWLANLLADAEGVAEERAERPGHHVVDGPHDERALEAESFATIRAEPTRWLWEGRIPLGSVTLLVGREKLGKSTLTVELAARLSRGELPGDLAGQAAGTLVVSYEDSASRTIKPRGMAAGADLSHLYRVLAKRGQARDLVSLPDDVEKIGALAVEHGARLIVVDPLSASLNGEVNNHRDQDIRRALAPLVQLAEEADLAVLALAHWNKAQGGDSLSRVLGSRGLTAAVRSVLAFGLAPDTEEGAPERVLAHAACNLGLEAPSLTCRIEGREVNGDDGQIIPTSRLVIVGESEARADDLLVTRSHDERSDRELAEEWLADELADGDWHESRAVKVAAKAAGIAERTLHRARVRLEVEDERRAPARGRRAVSHWRLPVVPTPAYDGGTTGLARQPIPHGERDTGPPEALSCQSSERGTTGAAGAPCDDPDACIVPTRPTAEGWRCERCGQYIPPDRGRERWRGPGVAA